MIVIKHTTFDKSNNLLLSYEVTMVTLISVVILPVR